MNRLKGLPIDEKALGVAELLMAALCVYRFINYEVTGFFVSDEFGYYYNAVHGSIYSDRWFFGWLNIYLFDIFHIRSPDSFAYFLPFFLFLWGGGTIFVFYRLLKLLGFKESTVALSVLSSFVLVSFVLLSLGFLTEGAGLCMAMCGTYFLVRFLRRPSSRDGLLSLALSAFFLGFAGGTREPYVAFEIGAVLVVALAELRLVSQSAERRRKAMKAATLSTLVFLIPTGIMLYANTATTSTIAPTAASIVSSILSNPVNSATATTTVSVTSTVTTTFAIAPNSTETSTFTTVLTTTQVASAPFYGRSLLLNTAAIFVGGIVLGWGPIAFPIAAVGFVLLARSSLRRDPVQLGLTILVLSALGSYLVVSFIFANIPTYMTFQNYSTIIRFSGTALPAFFISAPFFLDRVARNRKRVVALSAVVAAVLLVSVPAYQVYAISNLGYTTVNPFGLNYRSAAVQVRDYFESNPTTSAEVVGVPYGWYMTPGIGALSWVSVYSLSSADPLSPLMNYSYFVSQHWSSFYVYSPTDTASYEASAPFVLQFVPGTPQYLSNQSEPYTVLSTAIVIKDPNFLLVKVDLAWP